MGKEEVQEVNGASSDSAKVEKRRWGCVDWLSSGTGPVHGGLLVMQLGFAGHQVLSRVALTTGLSQFVYAIYRNGLALVIMGPFAYFLEKKNRPPLTVNLLGKFFLLGLTGILGSQQLFLAGLVYTSATFAATMQNAVPVITFLMAMMLGLEEVRIRRLDGQAKVLGTIVCVVGAVLMSVYKGPAVYQGWAKEGGGNDLSTIFGPTLGAHLLRFGITEWQLGGILLLINCISWAAYLIMQAPILRVCPTPLTITAFTYLFGSLQVGVLMLIVTGGKVDWALTTGPQIFSVVYAGVISSGINFSLQSWAIQKGGPLLVSLYTPVQTIIVAILSVVLLGDSLYLGSLVGGTGAVLGLYLVTWGQVEHRKRDALELAAASKGEDLEASPDSPTPVSSLTQPLLEMEESDQVLEFIPPRRIVPPVRTLSRKRSFMFDGTHPLMSPHHME